jgi:hypothetical protein
MMAGAVILPRYNISLERLLAGLAEGIGKTQAAVDECGENERATTVIVSTLARWWPAEVGSLRVVILKRASLPQGPKRS